MRSGFHTGIEQTKVFTKKTWSHVFSKYVEACEQIRSYDPVDLINIEDSPEKEKSHEHQNYGKQYEGLRTFTVRTKDDRYRA